jgi:hypothetical protein
MKKKICLQKQNKYKLIWSVIKNIKVQKEKIYKKKRLHYTLDNHLYLKSEYNSSIK